MTPDYKKLLSSAGFEQWSEKGKCKSECVECDKVISGNRVWYWCGDCYCKKCAFETLKLRFKSLDKERL